MVKERRTELVEGFRHSVPYINAHRGKTFVIMLGGEAIEHENFSSIVNETGETGCGHAAAGNYRASVNEPE